MNLASRIRGVLLLAICSVPVLAQLPPTSVTARPAADKLPVAVPASQLTAAERVNHRAEVVFADGKLQVTANDSSLNQILRAVARETGLKITGGVMDERVYGKFGPAPTSEILASLLDGTGSNMLLVDATGDAPAELILTARQGGPTPPNPNASSSADDDERAPSPPPMQQSRAPYQPPVQVTQPVNQTSPASGFVSAPTVDPHTEPGTTPGPNTQATGTSDPPQSPNGVKTPQQIYEQLQQLRQQQQQQAAPQ